MKSYTATEQDMQTYSRIISAITQLDMQREQYMQQLAQWENEHVLSEENEHVLSEDNKEETGEVALD